MPILCETCGLLCWAATGHGPCEVVLGLTVLIACCTQVAESGERDVRIPCMHSEIISHVKKVQSTTRVKKRQMSQKNRLSRQTLNRGQFCWQPEALGSTDCEVDVTWGVHRGQLKPPGAEVINAPDAAGSISIMAEDF